MGKKRTDSQRAGLAKDYRHAGGGAQEIRRGLEDGGRGKIL